METFRLGAGSRFCGALENSLIAYISRYSDENPRGPGYKSHLSTPSTGSADSWTIPYNNTLYGVAVHKSDAVYAHYSRTIFSNT